MPKAKKVNVKEFNSLSKTQQKKTLKNLAKRANVRLSLLEEKGEKNSLYKYVEDYNKSNGRIKNRFYEGVKYSSSKEIKETFAMSVFERPIKPTTTSLPSKKGQLFGEKTHK